MSLLDRYVGRIVAGAFGTALLFFLLLSILIDLLNNLPRYVNRVSAQGLGSFDLALYLVRYYVKLTPMLLTSITPFATVIACMFSVARLQQSNEVVPMLFTGRSMQRVLRPMLWCGCVAGLAMAANWQWVVPHVGPSIAAEESYLRKGHTSYSNLVQDLHGEVSYYLYVREFDPIAAAMSGVGMLVEGPPATDAALVTADRAVWDEGRADWHLMKGWCARIHGGEPQEWLERPDLTPAILLQQGQDTIEPDAMSYTDLMELSVTRPNRADVRLALQRHIAYPLANLLLLLLALPLAVFYERGSRIERLLLVIGLCGTYMIGDLICQSLGQSGLMHPIVAAWSPTIVLGSLGIVLFAGTKT